MTLGSMSDISEAPPAPVEETAPVVDAPAPDSESFAPESPVSESGAPESPPEPEDPFADFGGRETAQKAYEMYEASRTEDGVIQLFIEAGRNLGLSFEQMQTLFGPGEEAEPEDLDRPMTVKDWQEYHAKQEAAKAAQEHEAKVSALRETAQTTAKELGLDPAKDPKTYKLVLDLGDQYLKGQDTPEAVASAVRRGHADLQALVERQHQAYLQAKAQTAQTVPSAPVGASAPAAPPAAEPKNVAEAIAILKARRRAQAGAGA